MSVRTVVTTGANSGIGLVTAIELARRGFRSVGTVRSDAKAETLAKSAADAGVEVEAHILDVTDAAGCARLVDELRPYAIVNNAGLPASGAIEDVTEDEARLALETMLIAPMRLARLAIPHMREAGEGRIVNVSSIYGRATTPLTGWYEAAKHGLEGASDALRLEVARDGIRVVLVEPGSFRTALWDDARDDMSRRPDSRYLAAYRRSKDLMKLFDRVMGAPERVASVIADAVESPSPRARYLVGVDARAAALLEYFVPTAIKDRVKRVSMGL